MKFRSQLSPLMLATMFIHAALLSSANPVLAAPKRAPCAVCSVREGAGPEDVRATVKHEGKEYSFCSTNCRDEFLKNPQEFVKAAAPPTAPEADHKEHDHGPAPKGAGSSAPS